MNPKEPGRYESLLQTTVGQTSVRPSVRASVCLFAKNRCSRWGGTSLCGDINHPSVRAYLVDILRYSVHLLGPGHPGWRVSHNHALKFLRWRFGVRFSGRRRRVASPLMRWMSSCARGFPGFIGKSSAAPTPAWLPTQPLRRHLPCEAQRRAHFQRGCAAFTNRGKRFFTISPTRPQYNFV